MLDHYRSHQEYNWHKEWAMTGMSDKTNNQKQIDCQYFNNKMSKGLVDFSIQVGRVRRAAIIKSTGLDCQYKRISRFGFRGVVLQWCV
jgi:hypothetical protein